MKSSYIILLFCVSLSSFAKNGVCPVKDYSRLTKSEGVELSKLGNA